jgi:hypothetical protein
MLATLGGLVMMFSMYSFLALQMSLTFVALLLILGLLLVVGQFLQFQGGPESVSALKGDPRGKK